MTDPKYMRPGLDFATGKLVEELGELQAAIGKTLRWGRDSFNPELPPEERETNADWIEREIEDVLGAIANYRAQSTPPASPSVVADEPDAGEVTVSDEAEAETLIHQLFFEPADDDDGIDANRVISEAISRIRLAAHEAGKREGREEAAKVAENQRKGDWFEVGSVVVATGKRIATAIRALSQQDRGEGK